MILSFVIHQVEFLKRAWLHTERVSFCSLASPWTQKILDGSALHTFREALRLCERDPALAPTGYRRIVTELDKLISNLELREQNTLVRGSLRRELMRLRSIYIRKRDALAIEAKTQEVYRGRATLIRFG